jgi:hypothetical protein
MFCSFAASFQIPGRGAFKNYLFLSPVGRSTFGRPFHWRPVLSSGAGCKNAVVDKTSIFETCVLLPLARQVGREQS